MEKGKLYLIPVTLGDEVAPLEVLPMSIRYVLERTNHYIVENEKTARKFIKNVTPKKSQPDLILYPLNKFTDPTELPSYLAAINQGENIGLMSEAGVPGIADPGSEIVKLAHQQNIRVQPLVGPSSILMAMMSSGMNGQNFAFNGYLPVDGFEKKVALKKFEKRAHQENQAQAFIETPYRNQKLMDTLLKTLHGETRLCVACDITQPTEYILTTTIADWKKRNRPDLHKRPAIFIIQ